jgi:hypothetical protein
MKSVTRMLTCLSVAAALATGCAGDMTQQLASDPNLQTSVIDLISANAGMAGQMTDKLLASDSTRTMLVDKLLANGDASQSVMLAVARNSTMLDGVIGLAVQDPAMKGHVLTLLKGIEMAEAGAR